MSRRTSRSLGVARRIPVGSCRVTASYGDFEARGLPVNEQTHSVIELDADLAISMTEDTSDSSVPQQLKHAGRFKLELFFSVATVPLTPRRAIN